MLARKGMPVADPLVPASSDRMPARSIKAHDDGMTVRLDEPCDLPPDTPLVVMVLQPEEALQADRSDWFELAKQSLARAYGPDEPEYTDDDLIP